MPPPLPYHGTEVGLLSREACPSLALSRKKLRGKCNAHDIQVVGGREREKRTEGNTIKNVTNTQATPFPFH
jgi:hypothetical protein